MIQSDAIWLAGYLEGEGSFEGSLRKPPRRLRVRISAGSKDRDVIERVQRIAGGTILNAKENEQPFYRWSLQSRGAAVEVMRQVLPWMGTRRAAKIRAALALHETIPFGRTK